MRFNRSEKSVLTFNRLEEALERPDDLNQATIIERLAPREAARLSKVRNIGIAVRQQLAITGGNND